MTQLVVDSALPSKLPHVTEPIELLDGTGQLLGLFTPAAVLSALQVAQPELTAEEWQRREQETATDSTVEVLAALNALRPR